MNEALTRDEFDALTFEQVDGMFANVRSPATLAHVRLVVKRAFEVRDEQKTQLENLGAENCALREEVQRLLRGSRER